jgi:hypothetical protein
MKMFRNFQVKRLIKKIDKDIVVKFGDRLECDTENNIIYISYSTDEVDSKTFMEYVKELDADCQFDDITLGILHEIGHCFTYDEEMEYDYNVSLEVLKKLYENKKIDDKIFNELYVRLDLERMATEWALEFARNNKKFVEKLARLVK